MQKRLYYAGDTRWLCSCYIRGLSLQWLPCALQLACHAYARWHPNGHQQQRHGWIIRQPTPLMQALHPAYQSCPPAPLSLPELCIINTPCYLGHQVRARQHTCCSRRVARPSKMPAQAVSMRCMLPDAMPKNLHANGWQNGLGHSRGKSHLVQISGIEAAQLHYRVAAPALAPIALALQHENENLAELALWGPERPGPACRIAAGLTT